MGHFTLPRLRQAVLAAGDLDDVTGQLRERLDLREPYSDPGVGYFGLSNAVFAVGDTFLEVVSPVQDGTSTGRLLERRGGDCGYMVMFQINDLEGARGRAGELGIREVFQVSLEDMVEVHLHPSDMDGAIVSLSQPQPPESWRWAGPDWERRTSPLELAGATVAVAEPGSTSQRWETVLGAPNQVPIRFIRGDRGLVEVAIRGLDAAFELAGVRFLPSTEWRRSND